MAAFLGGYALVWSAFGAGSPSAPTPGCTRPSTRARGSSSHDWWIGGSVLALAGAFQFTSLKDACLDKCRHPAQFMMRYYERGPAGGCVWACATARSASAAAGR